MSTLYRDLSRLQCDQIEIRTSIRQLREEIETIRNDFKTQFGLFNDAFMARLARMDAMSRERLAFIDKTTMAQTTLCHSFSHSIQMLQQTTSNLLIAYGTADAVDKKKELNVKIEIEEPVKPDDVKPDDVKPAACTCYKTEKSAPGCSFCDTQRNHSYFE